MSKPFFLKSKFVNKGWGNEEWIVNNKKYCGKIRVSKKKATTCLWKLKTY